MTAIKLFRMANGTATELSGTAAALEKSLQTLIEKNLEPLLSVRLLASELSTRAKHGGRIDTLGLDENGAPVIIEYKRATNENVINQGLFYLDWLMDHQADFKLMVMQNLGNDTAETIDWMATRLLCIAGGFTRYDEHAVEQINRNIELIRYRRFGNELLLFELVNASSVQTAPGQGLGGPRPQPEVLKGLKEPLLDLYVELRDHLLALGDDVQVKELKYYVASRGSRISLVSAFNQRNSP